MCIDIIQRVFDAHCRLCGAPVSADQPLCSPCLAELPHLQHACPRCALPLQAAVPPGSLCGECLADPPPFDRARVALHYREPVNDLVSGFKYHHRLSDGRLLGQLLAERVLSERPQVGLILPLPLHPARLRERGFNQASELARMLSRAIGVPWRSELLQRRQDGQHQRETNKRQRLQNVRKAFACSSLPSRRIAIVDDVITTGATARAAAGCVKKAGAEWVEVWAVARTPRPGD